MQDSPEVGLIDDIDQLIKGAIKRIPLLNKIDTRTLACRIARVSQSYVEAKLHEYMGTEKQAAESEVAERSMDSLEP